MTDKEASGSELDEARAQLEGAEGNDDAARLEVLERLHEKLEGELDSDVAQESAPGR